MNLELIQTFLAVHRAGSFQKAAEQLFLPQPTVSHRMNQLEKAVGKPLIARRKSGNQLTLEGRAFYPYALQLLEVLEQGKAAVEKASREEQFRLELGCTNSLSNLFLYQKLQNFIALFPQTNIKVHSYSTTEVILAIRRGMFNLGVIRYSMEDTELSFKLMNSEHIYFIVSNRHPWASRDSVTLQDIARHQLVLYQEGKQYRETIAFVFEKMNLSLNAKYEMNNLELIKQMVAGGYGATLFAPSYMGNEVLDGTLVALPIENNPFPMRQTFLIYNKEKLNPVDQMFYDYLFASPAL
ncbi:LysR family transcriptional regulator [Cohnella cellulosilytica]|uniref:LysR family transcriptional regulator n=1 Tax=Cohnella cellulosilytica TaxID=986710 RepID=A0ABW2FB59_9BACL